MSSIGDCKMYWELPATAHFCSLFRNVFKLLDFDIDDLEEALTVDTDCAADGGRSTLIVDLLIALLKGCLNKADITLLNYNFHLWDLLQIEWFNVGIGPNPLGKVREKSNFHRLPKHVKIKLLWFLCEWRLERPDVEGLTKNLSGDSLRIQPLGKDDSQCVYWYFFGTRLYKEQPEPPKPKRKTNNSNKNTSGSIVCGVSSFSTPQSTPKTSPKKKPKKAGWAGGTRGKKKRKQAKNDKKNDTPKLCDSSPRRRSLRQAIKHSQDDDNESENSDNDDQQSNLSTPSIPKVRIRNGTKVVVDEGTKSGQEDGSSDDDENEEQDSDPCESPAPLSTRRPSAKSRLKAELMECSRNNTPTPSEAEASNQGTSVYNDEESRQEQEDEDDQNDETLEEIKEEMEEKFEDKGEVEKEEENEEKMEENKVQPVVEPASDVKPFDNPLPDNVLEDEETQLTPVKIQVNSDEKQVEKMKEETCENMEVKQEDDATIPWDQPLLQVDLEVASRWHVVCQSMQDWEVLVDSFKNSKSRNEKELYKLLKEEFQPTINEIYDQKEKESLAKYAELNRRSSNRLEFKRLQREEEGKQLAARENAERRKLAQIEAARQQKEEMVEKRERRYKLRQLEKERMLKDKERKKEERGKRLEIRRKRQELQRLGLDIPPELMNQSADGDESDSEDEFDNETMLGQLEKIIEAVSGCKDAGPFQNAVTEDIAPDYYKIIANPMCISEIDKKIREKEYADKMEFIDDMNAMFLNCLTYNGIDSDYTKLAQRLERAFIKAWKKHFPPQDLVQMNVEAQKYELKCIKMMGRLDKQIRHTLLGEDSSDEEDEIDIESPPEKKQRCEAIRTNAHAPPTAAFATHSYAKPTQVKHRTAEIKPIPRSTPVTYQPAVRSFAAYRQSPQNQQPQTGASQSASFTPSHRSTFNQSNIGPGRFFSSRQKGQAYAPYTLSNYRNNEPLQQPTAIPTNNQPATTNTVQYTPPNKPTVYLLPMGDGGHRMLKFVLKDGKPAPNHLVDQVLPALRQQANTLPKGVVTVTLDSVEDNGNETASSASQQNMDQQPCTSGQASSASNDPMVDNEMRQQATKVASQLSQLLSSNQNKIFGLGNNQFLSVIEGQPWILNKEESGNYRKVQMIERGQLEAKLREIQLRKSVEKKRQEQQQHAAMQQVTVKNSPAPPAARPGPSNVNKTTLTHIPPPIPAAVKPMPPATPVTPMNTVQLQRSDSVNSVTKPVCSVAPQMQAPAAQQQIMVPVQQGTTNSNAASKVYIIDHAAAGSSRAAPQGGQSPIIIHANTPVVLGQAAMGHNAQQPVQLIQLSMPQITINAPGASVTTANTQPTVVLNTNATANTHNDVLAEAWQATEDI